MRHSQSLQRLTILMASFVALIVLSGCAKKREAKEPAPNNLVDAADAKPAEPAAATNSVPTQLGITHPDATLESSMLTDEQFAAEKIIADKIEGFGGTVARPNPDASQKANANLPITGVSFLRSRTAQDDDLAILPGLTRLQFVLLAGSPVGDKGMASLGKCRSLRVLNLSGTLVTDEGLKQLASLSELAELDLSSTAITGQGLSNLRPLSKLTSLRLSNTKVDNNGLAAIALFRQLENLTLGKNSTRFAQQGPRKTVQYDDAPDILTDTGLVHLKGLPRLRHLSLWGSGFTDAGLSHLAQLTNLKSLSFGESYVTDAGIAGLKTKLKACDISSSMRRGRKQRAN